MRSRVALLLPVAVGLLLVAVPASAFTASGRVVKVADGDSFTVDVDGRRFGVRLNGIDAPELRQARGSEAREALLRLIDDRIVKLRVDTTDSYGRLIARVRIGTTDVGLAQIEAGHAWSYPWAEALPAAEKRLYAAAERQARAAGKGLWRDSEALAPWVFRRQLRERESQPAAKPRYGAVVGNRRSKVYHRPDCPGYDSVAERNRVTFRTAAEAERAGFRVAGNCPE